MIIVKALTHYLAGETVDMELGQFPDGTPHITIKPVEDAEWYIVEWYYENDAELFQVMCIKDKMDEFGCPISLFLPYIPNARMDRVKEKQDVFTLKTFCNAINSMKFNEVLVVDPHSNVSVALLDKIKIQDIEEVVETVLLDMLSYEEKDNLVLFYPDEGAMKRYSDKFKYPYTFGIKNRDWSTGKILGFEVIDKDLVRGKDILIIDDICSRGGTFCHAANALKALGANRIYLYVSHAEKTMIDGDMYNTEGLIEKIYTTNSIPGRKDPLKKIDIINMSLCKEDE